MRVRVTENTRPYYNYAVHDLRSGQELDGEFAHYLASTGAPVAILEADPEPATPPATDPADTGAAADPGTDGDDDNPPADEPPLDGTVDDLIAWVGGDPARAQTALTAEQANKARVTAVKALTELAAGTE